jgi:hypothetical protein
MTRGNSSVFALAAGFYLVLGFAEAAFDGGPSEGWFARPFPPSLIPPAAAQKDSDFYAGLADQSRATAASANRTAKGEQENASQFRKNAESWRDNAKQARETAEKFRKEGDEKSAKEFDDLARDAEESARKSEKNAEESDVAAKRAARRAKIAEREAKAFDEKSGRSRTREDLKERKPHHAAVLVDPNTAFHRLYVVGDPDDAADAKNLVKDKDAMRVCLRTPCASASRPPAPRRSVARPRRSCSRARRLFAPPSTT